MTRVARMNFTQVDVHGNYWVSEQTPLGKFTVIFRAPGKWAVICSQGFPIVGGKTYDSSDAAIKACQTYFRHRIEEWLVLEDHERGGHDKIAEAVVTARGDEAPPIY